MKTLISILFIAAPLFASPCDGNQRNNGTVTMACSAGFINPYSSNLNTQTLVLTVSTANTSVTGFSVEVIMASGVRITKDFPGTGARPYVLKLALEIPQGDILAVSAGETNRLSAPAWTN